MEQGKRSIRSMTTLEKIYAEYDKKALKTSRNNELTASELIEICMSSKNEIEMVYNAFRIGYVKGMKQAKKQ